MILRVVFLSIFISILSVNLCPYEASASSVQEFFPFLGEVNTEKVNIRAGQSVNYEKLCTATSGDKLVIVERAYSWYKIMLPSKASNYVSSKFIKLIEPDFGEVVGNKLNIRSKDSVTSSIIGQLLKGDKVFILEEVGEFYKIYPHKKSFGWISDKFIDFNSRDISKFSRNLSDEKEREYILKKQEEERIAAELKRRVTLMGTVEFHEDVELDGLVYKLKTERNKYYYLRGFNKVLRGFVGKKIRVVGKIDKNAQEILSYPLLNVIKFQLEL